MTPPRNTMTPPSPSLISASAAIVKKMDAFGSKGGLPLNIVRGAQPAIRAWRPYMSSGNSAGMINEVTRVLKLSGDLPKAIG